MENLINRFIKYAKVYTTSDEDSTTTPSTQRQKNLAKILVEDLKEIGIDNAYMDDNSYVYGFVPANTDKICNTIGFIAHMDTAPAASGENVKPQIHKNYNGEDIILNKEKNIVLSIKEFPYLKDQIGKTLITADGTTLLGADDKAGIAEIIEAIKYIIENKEIEHGPIAIGFTPDEEVGRGADLFDVKKFNANFAYTIDGGHVGELEYENFNAAGAIVNIRGKSVHPGSAKDILINATTIGMEFHSLLPEDEVPEKTEGYDGFYMITDFKGGIESATLKYIIRDFAIENLQKRKDLLKNISEIINEKYKSQLVKVDVHDEYYNMKKVIEPVMYVIELAKKSMLEADVIPKIVPIRGGTDGAKLSYMGLPTPNIFTGGANFHGIYEYISGEDMVKAKETIINIIKNDALNHEKIK
ncbi:MAG: peptidase T [Clostridiales bacterium]|uniref:peptidase T n=1 Tax=Terrisporobacter sp. TaxID=1965305 RepID=UPI002A3A49A7|nr:peptidase T [Terrisporobacter sp.]MCI7208149.1 peptidase T [Clostridium sp.]MDD5877918.1 peptidase T [Clostridiales bacterium]MDD7753951.1 peptidase T [Clostridiales bacterium]MDY4134053.1 peptidase T [Terrisporobacter sp.]MDY4735175.1 peptidase T [Terrisporobacter sp.]